MKTYNICVVGTGYVGLVTGACMAEVGHHVVCVDSDREKIKTLKAGRCPIHEPDLLPMIKRNVKARRLAFTTSIAEGILHQGRRAQVAFIAVGTPPRADGSADLTFVETVAAEIARRMKDYTVIVDKSTVPVETGDWVDKTVRRINKHRIPFDVASNPEFLAEGTAVRDTMHPDRIVFGVSSPRAEKVLREVYAPFKAPVLVTDVKSAELIKHASNSLLATKISFINAVSRVCEAVGADVTLVAQGMGLDKRIGPHFLRPGLGFGGFCLHPDEPVVLRDPGGIVRTMRMREAFGTIRRQSGTWEALSLDPKADRMAFMPVTAVSRRPYRGVMIRIGTKMGKSVRVTTDHPLLVRSGDGWETRQASDLTPSDWLPCFLSMPSSPAAARVDVIDGLKAARPDYFDRILVRPRKGKVWSLSAEARQALAATPRHRGRYHRTYDICRRGRPLSLPEYLDLESRGLLDAAHASVDLATAKGNATYIPAVVDLTPDFCRMLGYLASEGCLVGESCRRGIRERVSFHFHEKETEYHEDLTGILDRLGIKYSTLHVRQHKTRRITVSSRLFAFLLRDMLGCGTDSYTARVPDMVLGSPRAQRSAFLIGSLRGDGSMQFHKHSPAVTCEFGTVSPRMAEGMLALCHSLGIVPSHKQAYQNKSTLPAHFLRISGAAQIRSLRGAKGSAVDRRVADRLRRLKREPAPAGFRAVSKEVSMVRVTKIERRRHHGKVYSMEVARNNTLAVPSGLIVHNCFPKDLEAFYWIAKQKGYDFQLLAEVTKINNTQKDWVQRHLETELWNLEGKRVAMLGLTFKPNTDDLRFAPSLAIIKDLQAQKVKITAHDPIAMPHARKLVKNVTFAKDPYAAAKGADALVLATEWSHYKDLDFRKIHGLMQNPFVLDGRNLYDPVRMRKLGFVYHSVGRP